MVNWLCYALAVVLAVADGVTTRMCLSIGYTEGGLIGSHVSPLVRDLLVVAFFLFFGWATWHYGPEGTWWVWLVIAALFGYGAFNNFRKLRD